MKNGLIVKNTVLYAVANVVLRLISFLLIPIYLNYLSPEEYGLLSTILVTVEFLAIIMTLGMREAQIRFFKEYEEKNQLGTLMATSTLLSILCGSLVFAICLFILPSFFQEIFHVEQVIQYIILACSAAFVQTLFEHITTFYRAKNKAFSFTIINAAAALLLVIINCTIIVKFHYNVNSPLISQVLAYGIVFLVVSVNLFSRFGIGISKALTIKLLRFGLPLILSLSGQRIYFPTAIYMLSLYSGLTAVAIFSLGLKFTSILSMILVLPFQMAFQPFLFDRLNDKDIKETVSKLLTYFTCLIVVLSIAVIVGTKLILPFMAPPDYFEAFFVLTLSLPACGFLSLIVFGEALVNIAYKTYVMGIIIGLSGLFGVLLNYLLIPPLGWYGAIISLNLSSIVTGTLIVFYGIYCYPIRIDWKRILFSSISFILFVFCAFLFRSDSSFIFCLKIIMILVTVVFSARYLHLIDDREKKYFKELISNIQAHLRREKNSSETIK